jgi:hypothetical protein
MKAKAERPLGEYFGEESVKNLMKRILVLVFCGFLEVAAAIGQQSADISEVMMQSTFLIKDEKSSVCGTGFVILKRQTNGLANVFITANHVLTNFTSENAVVLLRRNLGPDKWETIPYTNRIRQGTKPLYTKHPSLDIVAFYISLPVNCILRPMTEELLITEPSIRDAGLGPGTELLNTGFPFGITSGSENFGFLRSGRIASYPILPVKERPTFELAITAFEGNSGGPVFISNYRKPGTEAIFPSVHWGGVVGILTTSKSLVQTVQSIDETTTRQTRLGFAGVIHAHFIKETIDLLPKLN